MKKIIAFLSAALICSSALSSAQSARSAKTAQPANVSTPLQDEKLHTLSGLVKDEKGEVLAGTLIVVKSGRDGIMKGTVTADDQGRYKVECISSDLLEFHSLGYDVYKETAGRRAKMDVVLQVSASQRLKDAVVIGYGSTTMADLTGSVDNVNMGNLRTEPVLSIDQALQGRVAGLEITTTDGEPGSESMIRIRGTRSINASNDPLIVVDGVMDAVVSLSDINPTDIESVSVLKDASATAIYGARGANGVILITTKGSTDTPTAQKVTVTLNMQAGFSVLASGVDLMNAEEYALYRDAYYQHSGTNPNYNYATPVSGLSVKNPYERGEGTDWIKDITRVAPYQNYLLSIRGFQGKQKFYASLGYNNEQGIILKSGKENFTGVFNYTNSVFKWLTIGANLRYQFRRQDNFLTAIGGSGVYYSAMYLSPLVDPADSYNPLNNAGTAQSNAVVRIQENTDNTDRSMMTITPFLTVKICKGLTFNSKFSYYYFNRQRFCYYPSTLPSRAESGSGGNAYRQDYCEQKMYVENRFDYTTNLGGGHHLDAMLGQTWNNFVSNTLTLEGDGYLVDNIKWNSMGAVGSKDSYSASTSYTSKQKLAFFARVNYNWKSRYYITVTGRADGASNFAENHKWGFFPSVAFKWSAANEEFLKDVHWLDQLALRLSVGQSGNDLNQAYRSLARMDSGSGGYPFGGSYSTQYWQSRIASPDLTWETTTEYNVGIDGAFLNNRLTVKAEAYLAQTRDLLLTIRVPQHTGYNDRYGNVGNTTSWGAELTLGSRNIVKRNFTWSTDFTISHNSSVVNDLGNEAQITRSNAPTGGYMMSGYREGYPMNSFWGFQYAGVWNSQEEIDRNEITHSVANAAGSKKLGYPVYIDQNHDGTLDSQDIVFLGSADPILHGGLQNNFRIRGFNVGVYLTYNIGGNIWNYSEYYMAGSRRTNQYRYMINAYHPFSNPDSELPRAGIFDANALPSSFMVHDASYIRLKNVSVGYTFNFKSNVLHELTLTASGENLYTWSNYNGFNPDVASNGIKGYDVSKYPSPLRVVFSVTLKY